jgi:tripartite-type tricarboxylate transporter receptor subunit TctC
MDHYKTSEAVRRLAKVLLAPDDLGRPFMATPGTPADRIKVLREAFMKAMNDAELLAEARKKALEPSPSHGDHLESLAKELLAQPAEVVERMKGLLAK